MRPTGTPRAAAAIAACFLISLPSWASPDEAAWTPPTAEQLAARERIRPAVEAILRDLRNPPDGLEGRFFGARNLRKLVSIGPDVAPFLESELELPDRFTFNIAALALGLLDTPGAADALRRADDLADREGGPWGVDRRTMALLGLAAAGETDALTRALAGATDISAFEFTPHLPLLSPLALYTYPASYEVLLAQLEQRAAPDAADRGKLGRVIEALGSLGDPRALPKILPFAADSDVAVRREVARALGRIGEASSVPTLLPLVRDGDWFVARNAAWSLARIRPKEQAGAVAALLDVVQDTECRVQLYRAVEGALGAKAFDVLKSHAGRPDFIDRTNWLRTMGATGDRRVVAMARAALADPDGEVAIGAVEVLRDLGGDGAIDTLLVVAATRPWTLAKPAIDALVERSEARVAPRVADRLFREILASPITDVTKVTPMRQMLDVLVEFGYVEPAARLRQASGEQVDGIAAAFLRSAANRLDRIREIGSDVAGWSALLISPEADMRELAAQRLARIGGPAAFAALETRFATAGPDDRETILTALARHPQPAAAVLAERVLDDPAFDDVETTPIRATAAWAARRIGGPAMTEALARSASRTEGLDLPTLVYWAQLAGAKSLESIDRLRLRRLRHFSGHRGEEQQFVDEIVSDLRAGRSIAEFDVPPWALHRH
ncbi:MAG TPA: HEAT repeat domain-containing protein [Candidatus Polarisedimenticolaceae bacterium]